MSIAKNLAAYLPAIIDQSVAQRPIGTAIAASELESYASAIYAKASRLSQPRDPLAYGKNLYTSLLNTIDRLISHRGCGTGITRTMWLHLKNIVMIHGDARDWSNHETGPILGALNATIADRLALSDGRARHVIQDLKFLGLIMPHNPNANGRRKIRRDNEGQPYGSGYSLLPLIVKLEELKAIVADFVDRRRRTPKAARQAIQAVRTAKRIIENEIEDHTHPSHRAVAAIETEVATARQSADPATLTEISEALSPQKIAHRNAENSTPLSTDPLSEIRTVEAGQKERSEIGTCDRQTPERGKDDAFGIESAHLDLKELKLLFPAAADVLSTARDPLEASYRLATSARVEPQLWTKSLNRLGPKATMLCGLIYLQHLADGQIRNVERPQSYFAGLVKLGSRRQLDIGATIWGRRELAGTHHKRSPKTS